MLTFVRRTTREPFSPRETICASMDPPTVEMHINYSGMARGVVVQIRDAQTHCTVSFDIDALNTILPLLVDHARPMLTPHSIVAIQEALEGA